jgi:hypothetical protein
MTNNRFLLKLFAFLFVFLLIPAIACSSSVTATPKSEQTSTQENENLKVTKIPSITASTSTSNPTNTALSFTNTPEIKTLEPTSTPNPTKTILPKTNTPEISSNVIIETAKIIDSPVEKVESILGSSTETLSLGIGDVEEVPDGGESRTYVLGKYTIWVNYDKQMIAKGLQVVEGLENDGYTLDQWPIILERIGVGYVGAPDIVAPAARRWTNAQGYAIMIAANKSGGVVWTVRIYKIPK